MSLETILAGCYLMLSACAFFLLRMDRRSKNAFKLYGEALLNVQRIEKQKLRELENIRSLRERELVEAQKILAINQRQLIEAQKITRNLDRGRA